MGSLSRRGWLKAGMLGIGAAWLDSPSSASTNNENRFSFHYDHILGTSLDVWLDVDDATTGERTEAAMLVEIDRLRAIFSTYHSHSELSQLNRSTGTTSSSPELLAVLRMYEEWQAVTAGACNAQVGAFMNIWSAAERKNRLPDANELQAVAQAIASPAWSRNHSSSTITKRSEYALNLNSIAKGFIIARIADVARTTATSGLVNLGGDMTAWGTASYGIGIQDPFQPQENAQPLGGVLLHDAAIATSGGYQRGFTIQGRRYSHLIDPRSGWPADAIASATVIAPKSETANVLATTLGVMNAEEGLQLVSRTPNAECLLIAKDGTQHRSAGFKLLPVVSARAPQFFINANAALPWPVGFQTTVSVELPKIEVAKRYRKPYVAVWVEDSEGKPVRTIAVWGTAPKYLKDLNDWWKIGKENQSLVKAVSRATRGPGKYDLLWDGKDDKGQVVSQGTYTVRVEVHREYGKHLRQSGKIDCMLEPATAKLDKNAESGEVTIAYGKKK